MIMLEYIIIAFMLAAFVVAIGYKWGEDWTRPEIKTERRPQLTSDLSYFIEEHCALIILAILFAISGFFTSFIGFIPAVILGVYLHYDYNH